METWDYKKYIKGDKIIWIVLIWLSAISLVIVYSSTGALAYRKNGGDTSHYFLRQLLLQGVGYIIIIGMLKFFKLSFYNKKANLIFIGSIIAVCLGLVFGRGGESTGRTLSLGILSIQPAEIAKVAIIIWIARLLAKTQKDPRLLRIAFFKIMTGVSLICLPIMLANFSSAALLFGTAVIMMFVGRVNVKYLGAVMLAGIGVVVLIYFTAPFLSEKLHIGRFQTIRNRIERKIHGDKDSVKGLTQDDFAMIAINRGGISGVGVGKSEISNFMPAAYNDFIYSIIIEEYGLPGGIIVLLLYIILFTRGGIIIGKCRHTFPMFLATGAVTLILLQALINMAVSSGVIVTGQPLPWISWGGSSQILTAVTFGLLLSVSYETDQESQPASETNLSSNEALQGEDVLMTKN